MCNKNKELNHPTSDSLPQNYQDIISNHEDYIKLQINSASFESTNQHWKEGQRRFINAVFSHLDRHLKILDVACGDGVGLMQFKELGFHNVVGVEINNKKIELAKKYKYPVFGNDMHDLSCFPDNEFDIIYCSHTLEHAYNPTKVLNEFRRIVKPYRFLFVVLPYPDLGRWNDEVHGGKYELGTHISDDGKTVIDFFKKKGFDLLVVKFDSFREPEIWLLLKCLK